MFQSLIGELKTGDLDVDTNLNVDGFQSLIGELKTEIDDKVIRYETFLFQSLIGELKTPNPITKFRFNIKVSIPHRRAKNQL